MLHGVKLDTVNLESGLILMTNFFDTAKKAKYFIYYNPLPFGFEYQLSFK